MKVLLIRHGRTKGNTEHRYVGRTDEHLLNEERQRLEKKKPVLDHLLAGSETFFYISPMARCRETAKILAGDFRTCCESGGEASGSGVTKAASGQKGRTAEFHGKKPFFHVEPDFREMDFGRFEYKNYEELEADPETRTAYQAYIDSGGESAFPEGESKAQFEERVVSAAEPVFRRNLEEERRSGRKRTLVLFVHGGTVMAILDRMSDPHQDYFYWRTGPGEGYIADLDLKGNRLCLTGITSAL